MSYRVVDSNQLACLEKDADLSSLPCIYVDNLPNGLDGRHYFASQYNFTNEHLLVLVFELGKLEGIINSEVLPQNIENSLRKTFVHINKILAECTLYFDIEKESNYE